MIANQKIPPLRLLRTFCIAARHSSFKVAADRLALTPSAVSHQVKELEEQLGVTLFVRRTRAVVLTPAGRQLLDDLEPALDALGVAISRASRGTGVRQQLTVVMPPFFASELFAARLPDFHERNPNIDLHVDTSQPRPDHHPGFSDLSVVLLSRAPADPEVEFVRLLPLKLVAVASPAVAASMAGKTGPELFANQTLIMHRSFRTDAWEQWLEQAQVDLRRLKNVVEFDNMMAVARAAERGVGVALMPAIVGKPWFERGDLIRLDGLDIKGDEAYFLACRRDDRARPEIRAFTDWMVDQFQIDAEADLTDENPSPVT